jgi:Zn-dependent protease with chaperone function
MNSNPSKGFLVFRAVLAIVLMIGFYLLAVSIAGALAYVPIAEVIYAQRLHFQLAFFCIVSAIVILWAIVPRRDRFDPPGPRLLESEHPELFKVIREVAGKTGQEMPSEVYLCPDVNAWVAQRGGVMGFGSRRVMGIGLPLLHVFTVNELRAVLAHEFGHYHGGDTKLGPWIFKTRSMIGRTLHGLGNSFIQKPFLWYGNLFLRITHAISRRQEYLADELAARVVSPLALISGLKKVHLAAVGFNAYMNNELGPVIMAGMRSPFLDGFNQFRGVESVRTAAQKNLEEELKEARGNPYDTHPALKDRIGALERIQSTPSPEDSRLALELLSNPGRFEPELLEVMTGRHDLKPVPWSEVGEKVFIPSWRKNVNPHFKKLSGKTVADVFGLAQSPESFIRLIAPDASVDEATQKSATIGILGSALCVTLYDQSWRVSAALGEKIRFSKDQSVVEPFDLIQAVIEVRLDRAGWDLALGSLGAVPLAITPPLTTESPSQ